MAAEVIKRKKAKVLREDCVACGACVKVCPGAGDGAGDFFEGWGDEDRGGEQDGFADVCGRNDDSGGRDAAL